MTSIKSSINVELTEENLTVNNTVDKKATSIRKGTARRKKLNNGSNAVCAHNGGIWTSGSRRTGTGTNWKIGRAHV
jgi:hypothetical protein